MHPRAPHKRKPVGVIRHMDSENCTSHTQLALSELQDKLTALSSSMTRPIDAFSLFARLAPRCSLPIRIPETLLVTAAGDKSLFLTDLEGCVHVLHGDTAQQDFLSTSSLKNKSLRYMNPLGVRYPKFITFREGQPEFTLLRMADIRRYINEAKGPYRIQRYIVPEAYAVRKTIVHWRRIKRAHEYTLSSRIALKGLGSKTNRCPFSPEANLKDPAHPPGFTLDMSFIASSRNMKSCDVTKELRVAEAHSELLTTLKTAVLPDVIDRDREKLEEFLFHIMKSQDGDWYFLDLKGAKVSVEEGSDSPKLRVFERKAGEEVVENRISERLRHKPVPYLNSSDLLANRIHVYNPDPLSVTIPPPSKKDVSSEYISTRIAEVSSRFDVLRIESQELKKEFGVLMKVQFANYPKTLLGNVIHRVYEMILRDSRLSRYYLDKSRVYTKVESAVKQIFQCGSSRYIKSKMRAVHAHMGITNFDFDLYVRYFGDAMKAEHVSAEEVDMTKAFLSDFREYVVQLPADPKD